MNVVFVIGAVITGMIVMGVIAWHLDKKRTEAFEAGASGLGLSFSKKDTGELAEFQSTFELFGKGRSRKIKNVTYGVANGTGVWLFDYRYTTGSGKNSHTHRQTVACFRGNELALPTFSIKAEGMLSKLGNKLFRTQDIDFDSHPVFSKKWLLQGDVEQDIRDAFTPNVLEFFEQQDKKLRVEAKGPLLLVYRAGKPVKPAKIPTLLQEGFGVFSVLRNG